MSIGSVLREEREEKKLSIADVSAATKVNRKYIQALEDDNYLLIPSRVYAKGFLKAYANFLGLDAKSLIDELVNFYDSREETKKMLPSAPKMTDLLSVPVVIKLPKMPDIPKFEFNKNIKFNRNIVYAAVLAAFVLFFLISVYEYVPSPQKNMVPIKANPPAAVNIEKPDLVAIKPPVKSVEEKVAVESPVPAGRIEVKLETVGISWIAVSSGAKELYKATLGPGVKLRFIGREIKVKAGNGGGVKVYINGEFAGVMGEEGVVAEKTYRTSE
ncbi:MAG: RodZ domain-containing protein [bacterium]